MHLRDGVDAGNHNDPGENMRNVLLTAAAAVLMSGSAAWAADPATPASDDSASTSCADMMTKAKAMPAPSDATKAKTANDEMAAADTALKAGDETTCKSHMQNAMAAMGGGM
jgi:hypothetical protein